MALSNHIKLFVFLKAVAILPLEAYVISPMLFCHFAASAKIALSLMLTKTLTLTLILTLIPILTQALTYTEEKHYFASRGKIASSFFKYLLSAGSG